MSDNSKIDKTKDVMSLIKQGRIKMRPKWYFILGSLAMISSLAGLIIISVFLISVVSFSLRTHGPLGAMRFEQLISAFPWEAVMIAVIGIGLGIWIMQKYDFSYKKNFLLIIISFVSAVLLAGWLINYTGLDNMWMEKGPMKGFYQRYDGGMMRGPAWRAMQNDNDNQPQD